MKSVLAKYTEQILAEGEITAQEVEDMRKRIWGILEENYEASKTYKASSKEWVSSTWPGKERGDYMMRRRMQKQRYIYESG